MRREFLYNIQMRNLFAFALALSCVACQTPESSTRGVSGDLTLGAAVTPWNDSTSTGKQIATAHYHIYTTANNQPLLSALPGFMEAAHVNHLALTGLPERPQAALLPVYIMGTRKDWEALTVARFGEKAPMLSIEAGGYCHEKVCVLWDMGGLGTLSTASHEGMHQFLAHRMKNSLPMWLEEGVCTLCEGYEITRDRVVFTQDKNASRFGTLRGMLMRNDWTPLEKLLPLDAGDVVTRPAEEAVGYYGQLWALALMLRTPKYRPGLERLMADAEGGKLLGGKLDKLRADGIQPGTKLYNRTISVPVFRQYIATDLAAFDREYRAFAEKLVKRQ